LFFFWHKLHYFGLFYEALPLAYDLNTSCLGLVTFGLVNIPFSGAAFGHRRLSLVSDKRDSQYPTVYGLQDNGTMLDPVNYARHFEHLL